VTGVGLRPTWKRVELPPNPKRCARLISIPINSIHRWDADPQERRYARTTVPKPFEPHIRNACPHSTHWGSATASHQLFWSDSFALTDPLHDPLWRKRQRREWRAMGLLHFEFPSYTLDKLTTPQDAFVGSITLPSLSQLPDCGPSADTPHKPTPLEFRPPPLRHPFCHKSLIPLPCLGHLRGKAPQDVTGFLPRARPRPEQRSVSTVWIAC
jgi:hypothetical protein